MRDRAAVLSSAEDFEGHLITLDKMSYAGWRAKLRRALKELDAGGGIELETFLKKDKKTKRHRR